MRILLDHGSAANFGDSGMVAGLLNLYSQLSGVEETLLMRPGFQLTVLGDSTPASSRLCNCSTATRPPADAATFSNCTECLCYARPRGCCKRLTMRGTAAGWLARTGRST